jgi:phage shock protein B
MGGLVIIVIVAIVVWGVLHFNKQRMTQREIDMAQSEALAEAMQERDELRERVKVLERIVTDNNTPSAVKQKRLAEEIEDLRGDAKD